MRIAGGVGEADVRLAPRPHDQSFTERGRICLEEPIAKLCRVGDFKSIRLTDIDVPVVRDRSRDRRTCNGKARQVDPCAEDDPVRIPQQLVIDLRFGSECDRDLVVSDDRDQLEQVVGGIVELAVVTIDPVQSGYLSTKREQLISSTREARSMRQHSPLDPEQVEEGNRDRRIHGRAIVRQPHQIERAFVTAEIRVADRSLLRRVRLSTQRRTTIEGFWNAQGLVVRVGQVHESIA